MKEIKQRRQREHFFLKECNYNVRKEKLNTIKTLKRV